MAFNKYSEPNRGRAQRVRTRWAPAALCASMTVLGCSGKTERPAPPTFPVTGVIKVQSGPLPVGGSVEFKPAKDELTATGVIKPDGSFTLSIPYVDRKISGATAGPHKVFVIMPLDSNRRGGGYVPISGEFNVLPQENVFTITMPKT
jgi:hypothetical protein